MIQIARKMFEIGAVSFNHEKAFEWSSGIKSPIYCDHRLILSDVFFRNIVVDQMAKIVIQEESHPDVIAGVASAAIPYAAWISDKLNLPMVYVRSKRKKHGKKLFIEGLKASSRSAIIIEDVLTTGNSALRTAEILKQHNYTVCGIVCILNYRLKELEENMERANIKFEWLYDFNDLIRAGMEAGILGDEQIELLNIWKKDPWSYG